MAPNHKVTQHSVHVVLQSYVTNKNHISSTGVSTATKPERMVTYFERLLTIKSFYALITWSRDKQKSFYIHNQSAYGYKPDRMITYLDEFLPIKLHHPLITWSCNITWQTKTILSPLAQSLWPPNLLGWWYTLSGS